MQRSRIVGIESAEGIAELGEIEGASVNLIDQEGESLNLKLLGLAEVLNTTENLELVSVKKCWVVTCMVGVYIVGCEPRVLKALLSGDSLCRVFLEHLANEIFGGSRDCVPICGIVSERLLQDIAENFLVVVSFKGRVSAQEDEQNDTKTPDIARFVVVALKDFRSDIVWGANNSVHALNFSLLGETFRETKVNQLNLRLL